MSAMLAENYSRGSEMVKQLLGEEFEGVLGSDFYASYNIYAGLQQSCLVQPLRDIHELKEQFPDALAERSVHPPGHGVQEWNLRENLLSRDARY